MSALLVGYAVSEAFVSAEDAATHYFEKNEKPFSSKFTDQANIDALYAMPSDSANDSKPHLSFDCIGIKQVMKDGKTGFYFVGKIETSPDSSAAKIVPLVYGLHESTAETGATGKVRVVLHIRIRSIIATGKTAPNEKTIADETIQFPFLQLPDSKHHDKPPAPLPPPWFPLPPFRNGDGYPTTVTVSVSEDGTGSPDYAAAKSEAASGLKAASGDVGKSLASGAAK